MFVEVTKRKAILPLFEHS